ncbi:MAG: ABC transporter permease [Actinomycetota bacterium]|nr:ABC transporter permease [Actinomycetota bacterium]
MTSAIVAVIEREFRRSARQRGRLLSTVARPLLWLVVVGTGLQQIVSRQYISDYREFLLPGVLGLVVVFGALLSALSTVHDRELGPMRMLMAAPLTPPIIVAAKVAAAGLVSTAHALLLLPLVWVLGLRPPAWTLVALPAAVLLTALALAAIGMVIASRLRSIENFAAVMNFVLFPMFFLSGALYPVSLLPSWLQAVVKINPLTYGIDLIRQILHVGAERSHAPADFAAGLDVLVLALAAIIGFVVAAVLFDREPC